MSRARPALVKRFVVELTKKIFDAMSGSLEQERYFAALLATTQLYHAEVEELLSNKLPTLADHVEDANLGKLLIYVSRCGLAWPHLGTIAQDRLRSYVAKTQSIERLAQASRMDALRSDVLARLTTLSYEDLADLTNLTLMTGCIDEVVRRFETSSSFKGFSFLRRVLRNEAAWPTWSATQLERMLKALQSNTALRRYMAYAETACEVLRLSGVHALKLQSEWQHIHALIVGERSFYAEEQIREVFPMFPDPSHADSAPEAVVEPAT